MTTDPKPQKSFSGRWTYGIVAMAFLFVLMPFLFWNATWFGRPLTDAQIAKALADRSHPRQIQHALTQIETRIEARDASVRRWYPDVVTLAADPVDEIRVTDAWVMGQDNTSPDFHRALLNLLADPNPMVQRNAALSLVRFADDSGRSQIVAMLRLYEMPSPSGGVVRQRLKPGDVVNPGTMVGHINVGDRASKSSLSLRARAWCGKPSERSTSWAGLKICQTWAASPAAPLAFLLKSRSRHKPLPVPSAATPLHNTSTP